MLRYIFLLPVLASSAALAQSNQVTVGGGQVQGAGSVNMAAGSGNAQANVGIVAEGGIASTNGTISQISNQVSGSSISARASIADLAFAGSTGLLAVSGAAGNDNQQANVAAIAFGTVAGTAGDILLSQTRASQEPAGRQGLPAASGERSAEIGEQAFAGSSGLVQVSLIGGDRNTSANSFALSVSGGPNP